MKNNTSLQPKSKRLASTLIALLLIAIGAMWLLRVCSRPHSFGEYPTEHISGGDTIDVAIEYSPLTFYQYGDSIGGFDYDLLRAIADEGNLKIKFHPVSALASALDGLRKGHFDLVVADVPTTTELREQFAFTEPAFLDRQVLVQRRDSASFIASALDLAGQKVWVPAESPAVTRLANLSAEIGDTIYVVCDSLYGSEQLVILTATGEIERAVVNERIAKALASDYPDIDVSTGVTFTQFQSWLMRHDSSSLATQIDTLLVHYKNTPAYAALHLRYFGEE
ncbi:MAG: transporter substrate-binding domain-containing protein [Bacteroides sp.]|nr:transporter substrate-binding domain-containing protein [Bacteroides sp.]